VLFLFILKVMMKMKESNWLLTSRNYQRSALIN
ncbi:glycerophosphodiester phosphodiesterase, partial [Bacillus cereus]